MLRSLLLGSNKRKMVSATILLIVGFLLHIKNKRPEVDSLKNSRAKESKDSKKVYLKLVREERETLTVSSSSESQN
jgi:hypothetical protein